MLNKISAFCHLLIFIFFLPHVRGQDVSNSIVHPTINSPDVSTLGKFGNIPISPFTGAALITVPLLEIPIGNNKIPVSLIYDASGSKPDQRPSVVGLNFVLNAGGSILRRANGAFDERLDRSRPNSKASYLESGANLNAAANWNTPASLTGGIQDQSPDEFVFNFNGITGSFYLNHEKKWIVKCKNDPNIKIEVKTDTDYPIERTILGRVYTGFTLTMGNGIKYIFGYDFAATEFSSPSMHNFLPSGWSTVNPPFANTDGWEGNVHSSAWQLTKILYMDGNSVEFKYKRGQAPYMPLFTEISEGAVVGMIAGSYDLNRINEPLNYMVMTSILTQIKTSQGVVCDFESSLTKDLRWPFRMMEAEQDVFPIGGEGAAQCYKVDRVILSNGVSKVKQFNFHYIEKSTERLKLEKIESIASDGNTIAPYYSFTYNDLKLPAYASGRTDHWGYFNGKNYWKDGDRRSERYPDLAVYNQSREADTTLMKAEIIRQIRYPTGGYTIFTFEPHSYSSVVLQSPKISIQKNTTNSFAGGMRLKKTEDFDGINAKPKVAEYFYTKNYLGNGTLSSGVLNGKPIYYEAGKDSQGNTYKRFNSLSISYLNNSNGSHISYSEVTEKTMGGYKVLKFSNHDNGYLDKDAFAQTTTEIQSSRYDQKLFGSLLLERGLLLSEQIFTDKKAKVKKIEYKYNNDPTRYNNYVRSVYEVAPAGRLRFSKVAFPIYTFVPYLKSSTTIQYGSAGDSTVSSTELYYNQYSLLQQKRGFDSGKIMRETSYKYPFDFPVLGDQGRLAADIVSYKNANMVSLPVEISTVKVGTFKELENSEFLQYKKGKPISVNRFDLTKIVNTSEIQTTYTDDNYIFKLSDRYRQEWTVAETDIYGNPLVMIRNREPSTCYIWGYNGLCLLAEIRNVVYSDMLKAIGGAAVITQLNSPTVTESFIKQKIDALRIALPKTEVTSYAHKPLIGILSKTDPKGVKESYEYDLYGRLSAVIDDKGNIVKTFCYNYRWQLVDCNGNRKLPITAFIVSLAYGESIGISGTALCASNNRTEYYILNPSNDPDPGIIVGTVLYNLEGSPAATGYYSRGTAVIYVGSNGRVERIDPCDNGWVEW